MARRGCHMLASQLCFGCESKNKALPPFMLISRMSDMRHRRIEVLFVEFPMVSNVGFPKCG